MARVTFSDDQGFELSQQILNHLHFHFSLCAAIINAAGVFRFLHPFFFLRLQVAAVGTEVSHKNKVLSSTFTLCPTWGMLGFGPRLAYEVGVPGRRGRVVWRLKPRKRVLKSSPSWKELHPRMGDWKHGMVHCSWSCDASSMGGWVAALPICGVEIKCSEKILMCNSSNQVRAGSHAGIMLTTIFAHSALVVGESLPKSIVSCCQ